MTPERLLVIKQLLTHPCGVSKKWTENLAFELLKEVERLNEEKRLTRGRKVP